MPLFTKGEQVRNSLVMHDYGGNFAIRDKEWKLLLTGNQTVSQNDRLYSMKDDPREMDNIIEKHPDIVQKLKDELNRYKWQGYSNTMDAKANSVFKMRE